MGVSEELLTFSAYFALGTLMFFICKAPDKINSARVRTAMQVFVGLVCGALFVAVSELFFGGRIGVINSFAASASAAGCAVFQNAAAR